MKALLQPPYENNHTPTLCVGVVDFNTGQYELSGALDESLSYFLDTEEPKYNLKTSGLSHAKRLTSLIQAAYQQTGK